MRLNTLSIKKRVTLYYSLAMGLISLLIFAGFFLTGSRQAEIVSKGTIMKAVRDSFEDITCDNQVIEINSDFDVYEEGVTLLVYGDEGNLIKGAVPGNFPYYTPLSSDEYNKIVVGEQTWLVYDLYMTYENGQGLWVRGIYAMDNTERTVNSQTLIMLIALPFIIILAIVIGGVITKHAFDPIGKIIKTANTINNGSDLSKRLPEVKNKDELYALTETLNLMIERLENAFDGEKQFSSDVSHELKTPVSVILAECEYALQKERGAGEYRESLKAVENQCKKIMSLIQQLLQLSRTINTAEAIEKEEIDLSELCRNVCEELTVFAKKNSTRLITDIEAHVVFRADEMLIMRMLINLVTNGVKYRKDSGEDSWVKISLKAGKEIEITVTDNGIGIGREDLKNVFNRFYKADKARTSDGDGFGLGLSMAEWIVKAHDGKIRAESVKGVGSRFTVTFRK